jgi:hypothetical protein
MYYLVKIVLQGSEGGEARAEVTDTILGTEVTEATEADTSRVQHDKIYQLLSEIESDSDSIGELPYRYSYNNDFNFHPKTTKRLFCNIISNGLG